MISETWLDNLITNDELNLKNFTLHRNDRNRHGGGVAIFIKDTITYKVREDLNIFSIECLWVEIQDKKSKSKILCAVFYRPPSSDKEYYEHIVDTIDKATNEDAEVLIMGDFNYDYKMDENLNSNPIKYIEDAFNVRQLVLEPTRVTTNTATTLDIILSSMYDDHTATWVPHITMSDHYPIITQIGFNKVNNAHKTITMRNYSKFDQRKFLDSLKDKVNLNNWEDHEDVNELWYCLKDIITTTSDEHAPIRTRRVRNKHLPWVDAAVIKVMHQRDKQHKIMIKTGLADDKARYQKLRNKVTSLINNKKKAYYLDAINNCQSNPSKFWKKMKNLVPNKVNIKSIPDSLTADQFNIYFGSVGRKTAEEAGVTHNDTNWKGSNSIHMFEFTDVDGSFVEKYLKELPSTTNLDIFNIDTKLLKISKNILSNPLTYLINLSLRQGTIPDDFKIAKVSPVFKNKGSTTEMTNYRPISVISHIAKLLEKATCSQLITYLENHAFISIDQSAYLKGHSTQTSLHRVMEDWYDAINHDEIIGVCYLDISKCYDTIDHSILINKLTKYGIKNKELKWFTNYLQNRKQMVSCNNVLSSIIDLDIGIPQGSNLGPILFLLFANDLGNFITDCDVNCFADDTMLYATGTTKEEVERKLQVALDQAVKWYNVNRLVINPGKCKSMVISRVDDEPNVSISLRFNNCTIEQIKEYTYLGCIIDDKLSWNSQISNIIRNVAPKLNFIKRNKKSLPINVLTEVYNKYIQPVLEYCSTIWSYTSSYNINRIISLQHKLARAITGTYDFINVRGADLLKDLHINDFKSRRDYHMNVLMYKCVHGHAPSHLVNGVTLASEMTSRSTRFNNDLNLYIPKSKYVLCNSSIFIEGAKMWNKLPNTLKEALSVQSFKYHYKKLFLKRYCTTMTNVNNVNLNLVALPQPVNVTVGVTTQNNFK